MDGYPIYRECIRSVLLRANDLLICGELDSLSTALGVITRLQPHIIVMDCTFRTSSALDFVKTVKTEFQDLPILIYATHDDTELAQRLVRAGARGYLSKQEVTENLVKAMRSLLAGSMYLDPQLTTRLLNNSSRGTELNDHNRLNSLSDRELEIFRLIGKQLTTGEIAIRLHLGVHTVETYRTRIKDKLGLNSAVELIATAALSGEPASARV